MLGVQSPPARSAPEVLMIPCAPLPEVRDGRLASLLENHIETAQLYHECAERHLALTRVLRAVQGSGPASGAHDGSDTGIRPVLRPAAVSEGRGK